MLHSAFLIAKLRKECSKRIIISHKCTLMYTYTLFLFISVLFSVFYPYISYSYSFRLLSSSFSHLKTKQNKRNEVINIKQLNIYTWIQTHGQNKKAIAAYVSYVFMLLICIIFCFSFRSTFFKKRSFFVYEWFPSLSHISTFSRKKIKIKIKYIWIDVKST